MDATRWDPSDDDLMAELGQALAEAQDVPAEVAEAARASYTWRTVDEELEQLTLAYDSAMVDAAHVRAAGSAARMLVFESEDVTIEVEVNDDVLMGQVVPVGPGRVVLEDPKGILEETEADDGGFFLFRRPNTNPLRFTWVAGDTRVVTQWVPL
jgi:hypothetical protein